MLRARIVRSLRHIVPAGTRLGGVTDALQRGLAIRVGKGSNRLDDTVIDYPGVGRPYRADARISTECAGKSWHSSSPPTLPETADPAAAVSVPRHTPPTSVPGMGGLTNTGAGLVAHRLRPGRVAVPPGPPSPRRSAPAPDQTCGPRQSRTPPRAHTPTCRPP